MKLKRNIGERGSTISKKEGEKLMKLLDKVINVPSDLVAFGRDRLNFHRHPDWDEWGQLMLFLKAARSTSLRWLADARLVGRRAFGDERVQEFEEQLELALPDLKAAEALASLECRSDVLSDEHHFVVAKKVEDANEQARWLETARREGLTPSELKSSIMAGRVVKKKELSGRAGGVPMIEGVRQLFDLWAKKVPEEQWKSWPKEKQTMLLEEIRPIFEMGRWLEESLSDEVAE
jgi:hypothetical protein